MAEENLPAHTHDSIAVRMPVGFPSLAGISRNWAFGGSQGQGVRVAVIDSGIDGDHPELHGAIDRTACADIRVRNGAIEVVEGEHADAAGHGTACAGIIHAVAPRASIASIRVWRSPFDAQPEVFARALEYVIEQRFDVVNLSIAVQRSEWALRFYALCDVAFHRGVTVVTAANNQIRESYPSLFASVISVACNRSGDPQRFHFNPSAPPEFLAHGIDVDVLAPGGGRTRMTGNSFAAPHISGMVALIRSAHPDLTPFQLKAILSSIAVNVPQQATARRSTLLRSRALRAQTT